MKRHINKLLLLVLFIAAALSAPVVARANGAYFDTDNIDKGFVTVFYSGEGEMQIGLSVNGGGYNYTPYFSGSRTNVFFPLTGGKVSVVLYKKIGNEGYLPLGESAFTVKEDLESQSIQIKSSRTIASSVELKSANLRDSAVISPSSPSSPDTEAAVQEQAIPLASQAPVNLVIPAAYNRYLSSTDEIRLSETVTQKARELIAGKSTTEARAMAVYSFIVTNFKYDWDFYNAVKSGAVTTYTPNASKVLSARKGICYDIASLLAAMLRGVGIPTKMVKGQCSIVGGYHAWNSVYDIESDSWVSLDATVNLEGRASSTYQVAGKGYSAESAE